MPSAIYENFDLIIKRAGDNAYEATVQNAPGGEDASVRFGLNDAPPDVLSAVTRNFGITNTSTPTPPPATGAGNNGESQNSGKYIFQTVFNNQMLSLLDLSLYGARRRNAYLRIRINLSAVPELVGLPWEMLCRESENLALSIQTSIVRYQNVFAPTEDLIVKDKPLRMLVVISNPGGPGVPLLNVEDEWQRIKKALQPMDELIKLERLERATLDQLTDRLFKPDSPVHIFHYIGHGSFDKATGKGQLLFEAETGVGTASGGVDLVDGERLGQSLRSGTGLRLAVLNSCEGAMVSSADSYAGVAQNLLRTGKVPVVIAMRKAITDEVAIAFANTFYDWLLVKNLPVDGAMTRARMRMLDTEYRRDNTRAPSEWATPILFMRNHDGYLVNFQSTSPVPALYVEPDADPAMAMHYKTALASLTKGKLVPFLGLDVNLFSRAPNDDWQPGSSTPPSYRELVKHLATTSRHPFPFIPALADVSQYALLHSEDEGTFYDDLANIFKQAGAPTALHHFWANLAAHNGQLTGLTAASADDMNRRFLIVSSTYDNLLETAFRQAMEPFHVVSYVAYGENQGKFRHTVFTKTTADARELTPQTPVIIETPNNYGGLYDQAPVILKIPGTVGEATKPPFAITEDQYLDFLTKRELASILPSQLLTKLRNSNHLFLGCNVREWSMRALLYRIWEDHKSPYASWAVMDPPTDVEGRYWEACKVKVIKRDLALYLEGLRKSCQSLLPGVQL